MTHRLASTDDSLQSTAQPGLLKPALAWAPILALILITALGALVGAGKVINLIYPVGALAIGIFLYFRYPVLYVGFTWWLWFLTPLVRRLADYKSGYTDPSPILLAPFLITAISVVTLFRYFKTRHRHIAFPFLLCLGGLAYSYLIGVIQHSPVTSTVKLLDWLVPIVFSFHLFVNWRLYPTYRQNIQRVFFWGVLVMGIYGVIQYTILPEWDRFWIINSKMASAATPEPFLLNVHSTLNDRGTCAIFMMAGLLLLSNTQNFLSFPATAFGYLTILLTTVRTSWIGLLLGFLSTAGSLKARLQMRLIAILLIAAICVIPLANTEPFASRINNRLQTLSNIEEDTSFQGRTSIYGSLLDSALTNVIGDGIGGGTGDSGFLTILLQLGWLGGIPYMIGVLLLLSNLFNRNAVGSDQFSGAARSLALVTFMMLPIGNLLDGPDGMIFWGFLGIGSAGRIYHHSKS